MYECDVLIKNHVYKRKIDLIRNFLVFHFHRWMDQQNNYIENVQFYGMLIHVPSTCIYIWVSFRENEKWL